MFRWFDYSFTRVICANLQKWPHLFLSIFYYSPLNIFCITFLPHISKSLNCILSSQKWQKDVFCIMKPSGGFFEKLHKVGYSCNKIHDQTMKKGGKYFSNRKWPLLIVFLWVFINAKGRKFRDNLGAKRSKVRRYEYDVTDTTIFPFPRATFFHPPIFIALNNAAHKTALTSHTGVFLAKHSFAIIISHPINNHRGTRHYYTPRGNNNKGSRIK